MDPAAAASGRQRGAGGGLKLVSAFIFHLEIARVTRAHIPVLTQSPSTCEGGHTTHSFNTYVVCVNYSQARPQSKNLSYPLVQKKKVQPGWGDGSAQAPGREFESLETETR